MKHMDIQTVTMDDLIILSKNKKAFCTSSRNIAEALEKKHKHVLEKIDKLLTDVKNNSYMDNGSKVRLVEQFDRRTYIDEKGEERPEYYIKEGGFYRLMNSFADGGKKNEKVFAWKDKFAELFEQMKKLIEQKQEITVNAENYVQQKPQVNIELSRQELEATVGITNILIENYNVEKSLANILAFKMHADEYKYLPQTGINMLIKALPPAQVETSNYNATSLGAEIAKRLNLKKDVSAKKINESLEAMGLQQRIVTGKNKKGKEKTEWDFTEQGKEYGNKFPYDNNGHTGYQIKWKESVIEKLIEWNNAFKF